MALSNSQYGAVMREYERLRSADRSELEKRRAAVYARIPELKDLEKQAGISAMERFRAALKTGGRGPVEGFAEEVSGIEKRKRELLLAAGFPEDALEPKYHCPECRDTGFVEGRKCRCFNQKVIKILYARSNIDRVLNRENFERFSLDYYDDEREITALGMTERAYMERVLVMCRRYTEEFDEKHGSILFQGNTGVGKTFLSHCIAKELIASCHSVIYLTAGELFDTLADVRIARTEDLDRKELYEYIFSCDLLIVDDLGTEAANTWTASQFFYLVNARLNAEKGTVISTNLSMRMLRDTYTERVTSRIASGYDVITLYGDDIRRKKRSL